MKRRSNIRSSVTPPAAGQAATSHGSSLAARPKIGDVAHLAEVSLGTVSAVLNENGRVSEATRHRVKQAIAQLGYRRDLYASQLPRRQTRLLGLVVSSLQNPFFAETAQAVEEEAEKQGFELSLMATNFSPVKLRAAITRLLDARIAGLAVLTSESDPAAIDLVRASGVPAVFLDAGKPGPNLSSIRVDARGGMRAAVKHLIDFGHRELLYVQNSQSATRSPLRSHRQRNQGFAAAVRACAMSELRTAIIDLPGPSAEAGEQAIETAFHSRQFTAVITMTDVVALGVYRGLQSLGLSIPRDVSVVSFDNTYFSRFLNPRLSTVDVPKLELSRMVIQALTSGMPGAQFHLPAKLIVRGSTSRR